MGFLLTQLTQPQISNKVYVSLILIICLTWFITKDPTGYQSTSKSKCEPDNDKKVENNNWELRELLDLAKKYRPDDWGDFTYTNYRWHYFEAYAHHMHHLRKLKMTVVHFGVSNGAAILMFQDYFPNARHVGIDIKKLDIHKKLTNRGVELVYGDAKDPAVLKSLGEKYKDIYLIIDDAFHEPNQILFTMNHMGPYLKHGGYYVIEDTAGFHQNCTRFHDLIRIILSQINSAFLSHCFQHPTNTPEAKDPIRLTDIFSFHVVPNLILIQKKKHMYGSIPEPDTLDLSFNAAVVWN